MTKFEFTKGLRKALSGRVSHTVVNENVAYYENYIDAEIKKGRSEKEVLEELGDPRLLAKTIIDTAKESETVQRHSEEEDLSKKFFSGRTIKLPAWIAAIILFLIVILVFKVVGLVLSLLLPILLPVAVVYLVIRYFKRR